MASNVRSSSSGVRNLRAMFETSSSNAEDSTSPPPRGRSPAGESVASNGSARPLSTVRTSFVAVERSGQLKRTNGDGGVEGKVDVKFGIANKDRSKDSGSEAWANGKTSSQDSSNMASGTAVGHLEKPTPSGKEQKSAPLPTHPEVKAVAANSAATNEQPPIMDGEPKGAVAALSAADIPLPDTPKPAEKSRTKATTAGGRAPAPLKSSGEPGREKSVTARSAATAKTEGSTSQPLPAPISVSRDATATKSNARAPASTQATKPLARLPKTPTTPNKPSHSTTATAKPRTAPTTSTELAKVPTKKPSKASLVPSTASASSAAPKARVQASSSSTATLSKPALHLHSSPKGKANPKSPTRPARLPSSIVAPTASSAAKTSNNPPSRPQSRESSSLRRQSSTIHKTEKPSHTLPKTTASVRRQASRPSLPERPHSRDAAAGRKSLSGSTAAPDEGFLARMMRPTASSASKTHEKLQEKAHDKVHERGDSKVVRKTKSVIRSTSKSGGSGGVATGDVKRDEHQPETKEAEDNTSGDPEQVSTFVTTNENLKPTTHQTEKKPPTVEGGSAKAEEGEVKVIEDVSPPPEVVPELLEANQTVAAAG
ncbi:hypothetical protein GP486_001864 [Trichoglossum hirsutum]|uniref:Mucin-7 n=1 Tax=Trichoglossum hirsutum TaxID=265104 RepID=A0A9P8LG40_9PEZI|nr:hypothetical protein GP486_001864 [Trichoglossum hirsutum]